MAGMLLRIVAGELATAVAHGRTTQAIMDRWNRILKKKVQLFVASYVRVTRVPKSGWSEDMYVDAALTDFQTVNKSKFKHLGCWELLRYHPKFSCQPVGGEGLHQPDDGKNEDASSVEDDHEPAGEERSSTDDTWKSEGGKDSEDSADDDLLGFESEDVFLKTVDDPSQQQEEEQGFCPTRLCKSNSQEIEVYQNQPSHGCFPWEATHGNKEGKEGEEGTGQKARCTACC